MPTLLGLVPPAFGDYFEPFVGAGALFFALQREGLLAGKRIFLSDANEELINAFVVVRDHVDDLIAQLGVLRALPHDEATYYRIRAQDPATLTDIKRAARMIYLNKSAMNGIHRVNKHGVFNVPFNGNPNPPIPAPDLLRADSRALQGATIVHNDFRVALRRVKNDDFVYIDSPYPGCFDKYTAAGFKARDHEGLAVDYERLASLGASVMASNADTDWVRHRYARFHQHKVMAPRSVSANGKKRAPVRELVIVSWIGGGGVTSPTAPASQEVSP